jgi:hypothetical protein
LKLEPKYEHVSQLKPEILIIHECEQLHHIYYPYLKGIKADGLEIVTYRDWIRFGAHMPIIED